MALDAATREELLAGVRRFVAERLRPLESRVAEKDAIPETIIQEMRDLGLFGLSTPRITAASACRWRMSASWPWNAGTHPAFRSVLGTNVGIGSQGLGMAGTPEQKTRWLPRIASGEIITSFCLTEAEAGSDSASVRTKAERVDDHYVLTGGKRYITNADEASLFTVMARAALEAALLAIPADADV